MYTEGVSRTVRVMLPQTLVLSPNRPQPALTVEGLDYLVRGTCNGDGCGVWERRVKGCKILVPDERDSYQRQTGEVDAGLFFGWGGILQGGCEVGIVYR